MTLIRNQADTPDRYIEVLDLTAHRTRGFAGAMVLKQADNRGVLGDGRFSVTLPLQRRSDLPGAQPVVIAVIPALPLARQIDLRPWARNRCGKARQSGANPPAEWWSRVYGSGCLTSTPYTAPVGVAGGSSS